MISGPIQLIKYNNKEKMGSVSVQLVEWYKDKNCWMGSGPIQLSNRIKAHDVKWDQAQYNRLNGGGYLGLNEIKPNIPCW